MMSCCRQPAIRHEPSPKRRVSFVHLVHQQESPTSRVFSIEAEGIWEGLHNEGDDEDRDHNRNGERLQGIHAARRAARRVVRPWEVFGSCVTVSTDNSVRTCLNF